MPDYNRMQLSRRDILTKAATGIAAAGLPAWFEKAAMAAELERDASAPKRLGANDQINLAVIGPGGSKGGFRQGLGDTRWAASKQGVKVVAVCDVDKQHREEAAKIFGSDTKQYEDFRELLRNKDIDAVVIGTPDHWHAVIAIAALKAGKDVYCEKPMTLTIAESKKIVEVVKKTKRVLQVGSQQRSDPKFRLACTLVRNGRIGKLSKVVAHLPTGPTGGPYEAKPVPDGFNFDMWLGPAPVADYFPERTHGNFRWFLDYSGGMMTDWGAHHDDIAQWGMGTDGTGPIRVQGTGKQPQQGKNIYDTFPEFDIISEYANGLILNTTNKGQNGVDFYGEGDKNIFVTRGAIRANEENLITEPLPDSAIKLYESNDHMQNFIDCIRSRKDPICSAEVGHRSVSICHLGNLSLRLGGRKLEWDPVKERFTNDAEANKLLARKYRGDWKL